MTFEKLEKFNKEAEKENSKEQGVDMECGENIHEIITCMRHGPKRKGDPNGPLAEDAWKIIKASAEDFSFTQDGKVFTSTEKSGRCQDTGKEVSKKFNWERIQRGIPALAELIGNENLEPLIRVNKSLWPDNFESLEDEEKERITQEVEDKIASHFLSDDFSELIEKLETKNEKIEIKMPRFEMAVKFAEWVKLCVNASKFLPSKTEINLVNVSHSFNLIAFLKEVMIFKNEDGKEIKAKDLEAKEFLDKIGGSIKTAEFFEIDVKRKDKKNFEAFLKFRGESYNLDFSRIDELAELAKQKRLERLGQGKN
ncbi:MAG: hypothetical protein U9P70_00230 [Patescibacteria group bacterium]|nr:hypothetical protein [Patescibacteria group bacterium]